MPQKGRAAQSRTLQEWLNTLTSVDLAQHRVVDTYVRWDPHQGGLVDTADVVRGAVEKHTPSYENYVLHGPSGSGKTEYVRAIARACNYEPIELNCSNTSRQRIVGEISSAQKRAQPCTLFLIDEFDVASARPWICGSLLGPLEANRRGEAHSVFLLVGSTPDLPTVLREYPKGHDLLGRVRLCRQIPKWSAEDRVVVFLAHLHAEARNQNRQIRTVEKAVLWHVMSSELTSGRWITELATRAVQKVPPTGSSVKVADVIDRNDSEWLFSDKVLALFRHKYLYFEDSLQSFRSLQTL